MAIFRILFIYLISFQMIHVPLSLAQTQGQENIPIDERPIAAEVSDEKEVDISNALTMSVIQMAAVALFAPAFVQHCSDQNSALVFAATAAIYIVMEIMNWSKYSDASEEAMVMYYEGDDSDGKQRAAIQQAADQTQKAADALKTKARNAKIAIVGFGLAAVLAFYEQYVESSTVGGKSSKCGSGGDAETSTETPAGNNAVEPAPTESVTPDAPAKSNINKPKTFNDMLISALNIMIPAVVAGDDKKEGNKGKMDKKAEMMGLLGGGVIGILASQTNMVKEMLEGISGMERGLIFAGFGILAFMTSQKLDEAQKAMQERADQYKSLLEAFDKRIDSQNNIATGPEYTGIEQTYLRSGIKKDTNKIQRDPCFTQTGNQLNVDKNCDCLRNNSCKKTNLPNISFDNFSVPTSVTTTAGILDRTGKKLFNGDTEGANLTANALVGKQASLKKVEDQLKRKLSEINGKKIPFDALAGKKLDLISNVTQRVVRNLPKSAQGSLAGMTGGAGGTTLKSGVDDKKQKKEFNPELKKLAKAAGLATSGGSKNNGMSFFLDDSDETKSQVNFDTSEDAISKAEFDYKDHDISRNTGVSIFKMITTRYQKSGYSKVFNEKKKKKIK